MMNVDLFAEVNRLILVGNESAARQILREAIALIEETAGATSPDLIAPMWKLASSYDRFPCVNSEERDKAIAWSERAVEIATSVDPNGHGTQGMFSLLAGRLARGGQTTRAVAAATRALEIATFMNRPLAQATCDVGMVIMSSGGDLESALIYLKKAAEAELVEGRGERRSPSKLFLADCLRRMPSRREEAAHAIRDLLSTDIDNEEISSMAREWLADVTR